MEKRIGYILLCFGIGFILFAVVNMWGVFSGKKPPPKILDIESVTLNIPIKKGESPSPMTIDLNPQVSKIGNMFLWSLLMLFIAGAGSKLGNLGIKLAKSTDKAVKKSEGNKPLKPL